MDECLHVFTVLSLPIFVLLQRTLLCSTKSVQRSNIEKLAHIFVKDARQQVLKIHISAYIHVFIERTAFESLGLRNINEEYFSKRRLHPVGHGSSSPYVMWCPLQQYKEVTSNAAVGKS